MKKKIIDYIKHPLIYKSGIVIFGGLLANFFNFLFNLFMSRSLSIVEYGILASVISLMSFPGVFSNAVAPLVMQFAGGYFALNKTDMLKGLYLRIFWFLIWMSLIVFIVSLIMLPEISSFLHIQNPFLLFVVSLMFALVITSVLNVSFIQAKMAFGFQVFMNTIAATSKLLLGVIFVLAGFSSTGAVYSLFLSFIIGYLVSFFPLKFLLHKGTHAVHINNKELFGYAIPSTFIFFSLTSFISTDILLVKHFFSPTAAGLYAGLSLVARVIFYVSSPIANVMFPLIVKKQTLGEKFSRTFFASLLIVFLPSIMMTIFYFLFPQFSLLFFLKQQQYLAVSSMLALFALFITVYSILFMICNFYMSIKKTGIYIPVTVGALAQIIFISLFHQTFLDIILISLCITFLLVVGLLLYYPHAIKK